jgi:hypothetical protein
VPLDDGDGETTDEVEGTDMSEVVKQLNVLPRRTRSVGLAMLGGLVQRDIATLWGAGPNMISEEVRRVRALG